MSKQFSITKKRIDKYGNIKRINIFFVALLLISFSLFLFYNTANKRIQQDDKVDIFDNNLQQIAFYFQPIDSNLSRMLLKIDDIKRAYQQGDNILQSKEAELDDIVYYADKNKSYLERIGFQRYETFMNLLLQVRQHKEEILDLLGKDQEYNYLVILQNTNEKRPNGGFFGSFAFVTLHEGRIKHLEIIDSYYPDYMAPKTRILLPDWAQKIFGLKTMGFVAGNKFGFTDMDGKNLKTLYEKIFNEEYDPKNIDKFIDPTKHDILLHKYIKGVIFIRLDLMEELFPNFHEYAWEWQFANASIDLIKGGDYVNKKEIYIQKVSAFFDQNKLDIFRNLVNKLDFILDQNYVNIYLSNVSDELNNFLAKNNLTTVFDNQHIYSRDTNNSFNKADAFIDKNIEIRDEENTILVSSKNDIIDISNLQTGHAYTMDIYYNFNVPEKYINFIHTLERRYDIQLTDREKSILAVQPANYDWLDYQKRWESNSTMYFADNIRISRVYGDVTSQLRFVTPFGRGLKYTVLVNNNNTTKSVKIEFFLE